MWIIATLIASLLQTARNSLQKSLVAEVGTIGATNARFLYGFPFALLILAGLYMSGHRLPSHLPSNFFFWGTVGAISQILATALMLTAMKSRSFVVTTALIKTEPLLVALFAFFVMKEALTTSSWIAVFIATCGVVLLSWKKTDEFSIKPILIGVLSASFFAISASSFRAGILTLEGVFYVKAASMLTYSLGFQAIFTTLYLGLFDKKGLKLLLQKWRSSLIAGAAGSFGSFFWFTAFSLQSAALVRTLALVEIFFAQIASGSLFKEKTTKKEALALSLIVIGIALLLIR